MRSFGCVVPPMTLAAWSYVLVLSASVASAATTSARVLAHLQITPEVFAACGGSGTQAAELVTRLDDAQATCSQFLAALESKKSLQASLRLAIDEHRLDPTATARDNVVSLRSQFAAAKSSFDAARQAVWQVCTDSLPTSMRDKLARATGRRVEMLPPAYRCAVWTKSEIRRLSTALAAERQANVRGSAVPQRFQSVLSAARADVAVSEAVAALAVNLDAVRASWAGSQP